MRVIDTPGSGLLKRHVFVSSTVQSKSILHTPELRRLLERVELPSGGHRRTVTRSKIERG
jgi:hypothetical protein